MLSGSFFLLFQKFNAASPAPLLSNVSLSELNMQMTVVALHFEAGFAGSMHN